MKDKKTVFITGTSTGIGRQTVILFQKKGWNVVATMRSPEKEKFFQTLPNVLVTALDVTKQETIDEALKLALEKFGTIDVLINNAGYGATGPFEQTPEENIYKQFETNVFGVMRMIKVFLPHFREKKSGNIVNIASIGGRMTFPLYSLYHGTKWAVEGFTESLKFELEQFNINVKLIEPGAIKTDFYTRSAEKVEEKNLGPYENFYNRAMPYIMSAGENGLNPDEVAKVIYKAATSQNRKLRYGVGNNTKFILFLRKIIPERLFNLFIKAIMVK